MRTGECVRGGAVRSRAVRRFTAILVGAVSVLSLMLFVGTLVLWVRSYTVPEGVVYLRGERRDAAAAAGGCGAVGVLAPKRRGPRATLVRERLNPGFEMTAAGFGLDRVSFEA